MRTRKRRAAGGGGGGEQELGTLVLAEGDVLETAEPPAKNPDGGECHRVAARQTSRRKTHINRPIEKRERTRCGALGTEPACSILIPAARHAPFASPEPESIKVWIAYGGPSPVVDRLLDDERAAAGSAPAGLDVWLDLKVRAE
eukprot:SAG22_NODE_388_length_11295_cov_14.512594_4_plen_144_part_00